jgi:peroxiredoxin Q/BCP
MRHLLLVSALVVVAACSKNEQAPPPSSSAAAGTAAAAGTTTTTSGELAVGAPAPDFAATAHDGFEVKPSALKGKPIVLYFYPKDETPGCTKEACSFRDAWTDLAKTGVVLVGISKDSIESHEEFAKHHQLPFHLVSDPDGRIAKAYGVGTNLLGMLDRQTIVIGADGNVKKIYRKVDVTKHAAEIKADLQS